MKTLLEYPSKSLRGCQSRDAETAVLSDPLAGCPMCASLCFVWWADARHGRVSMLSFHKANFSPSPAEHCGRPFTVLSIGKPSSALASQWKPGPARCQLHSDLRGRIFPFLLSPPFLYYRAQLPLPALPGQPMTAHSYSGTLELLSFTPSRRGQIPVFIHCDSVVQVSGPAPLLCLPAS